MFGVSWELHWNGTQLVDRETMLEWAKSMTWKGLHPIVELSEQVYEKGISLGQKSHAGNRSALTASSGVTQVGYPDPDYGDSLIKDFLFEKSP